MKYTLINCYADNNKGDLGIILATIDFIVAVDPGADIQGVSTFNQSDPCFESEHVLLRRRIPVLPAVFGELNVFAAKDAASKLARFAFDTLRLLAFCAIPRRWEAVSGLLFSGAERSAIERIRISDHVVSKGGSFLCNDHNLREKMGLIRFLYIFFVCLKLGKRVTILGQSLGPVHGRFSRFLLNRVLRGCESVVLRENACMQAYPYLALPQRSCKVNDMAFFLDTRGAALPDVNFDAPGMRVGMTIKYVAPADGASYLDMMARTIEHCIERHDATVYVFPHVTIENDLGNAYNVLSRVADRYKHRIRVLSGNYTPEELKKLYSRMDVFVGTRLHSTIFAIGELVPSICISYHGTKSQGVFANFRLEDYVVVDYSFDALRSRFDRLVARRAEVREAIRLQLQRDRETFLSTLSELFLPHDGGRAPGRAAEKMAVGRELPLTGEGA